MEPMTLVARDDEVPGTSRERSIAIESVRTERQLDIHYVEARSKNGAINPKSPSLSNR